MELSALATVTTRARFVQVIRNSLLTPVAASGQVASGSAERSLLLTGTAGIYTAGPGAADASTGMLLGVGATWLNGPLQVSASLGFIALTGGGLTWTGWGSQTGQMGQPTGSSGGMPGGGMGSGGMGSGAVGSNTIAGPGDIYFSGAWDTGGADLAGASLILLIKAPLASTSSGIGTGEWDVGGEIQYTGVPVSLRGGYLVAALGWQRIGDPPGIDYRDPPTGRVSVGIPLNGGGRSLFLSMRGAGSIIPGTPGPVQVGLALGSFLSTQRRGWILRLERGFTRGAPLWGLSFSSGWVAGQ